MQSRSQRHRGEVPGLGSGEAQTPNSGMAGMKLQGPLSLSPLPQACLSVPPLPENHVVAKSQQEKERLPLGASPQGPVSGLGTLHPPTPISPCKDPADWLAWDD